MSDSASFLHRLSTAISEGRLGAAMSRRAHQQRDAWRESVLRRKLGQPSSTTSELPMIVRRADPDGSDASARLFRCLDGVLRGENRLPQSIREIDGMSGQRYRALINLIVSDTPNASYLEIGSWAGSTATAALCGNRARAVCVDNWSEFGGPRDAFLANIDRVRSAEIDFEFVEADFRAVKYDRFHPVNVFLFDGPHSEADQYDGTTLPQPALDDTFTLIVDDWNWRQVRIGTFEGLLASQCRIVASVEVRTMRSSVHTDHPTEFGKSSDWHNGYFVAVVKKSAIAKGNGQRGHP